MSWSRWQDDTGDERWQHTKDEPARSRSRTSWHKEWDTQEEHHWDTEVTGDRRGAPPAKRGQRWWKASPNQSAGRGGHGRGGSYIGIINDMQVAASDRGRILGDRGSNVRRIADVMRAALGHEEGKHGRPPFVQFNENYGWLEFEIELYPPFNNEESFKLAEPAFREMVLEILDTPFQPASRHCFRPKKVQVDDWECPNTKCGNLCFARRKQCPLCGAKKPAASQLLTPNASVNVPDSCADPGISRPPKHGMQVVSTADWLGPPEPGHCQVVWLLPLGARHEVSTRDVSMETGAQIVITRAPETRHIDGFDYVMVFIRGVPGATRTAIEMFKEGAGGFLAEDGFKDLLDAVRSVMEDFAAGIDQPIRDIIDVPAVSSALSEVRTLMWGCGLRSLVELLEQWPAQFLVRRTGPQGATVARVLDAP